MPAPNINTQTILDVLVDGYWAPGSASLSLNYSAAIAGSTWPAGDYPGGSEPYNGYSVFNATQRAAFYVAMELWDSYVGASFNATTDTSTQGTIRVAFTNIVSAGVWGYATLPNPNQSPVNSGQWGDIWVDNSITGSSFEVGGYDFMSLLHEIGHALGLDHSFFEPSTGPSDPGDPPSDNGLAAFDDYRYSIMSYTQAPLGTYRYLYEDGGVFLGGNRTPTSTPMIFDIFTIQSMYGADPTTRAGNTTYTFDQNAVFLQTIYDAGGIDKIDLATHTRPSNIDLRPGSLSTLDYYSAGAQIAYWQGLYPGIDPMQIADWFNQPDTYVWSDNLGIAYNTIIENVIGGSKNDTFTGNGVANNLQGRAGNDKLNGGNGADTLSGGVGNDDLKGETGHDTLIGGTGLDDFIFKSIVKADSDVISDFSAADDTIWLDNAVLTAVGPNGALASAAFWANTSGVAHDVTDRVLYKTTTGEIFYDADGTGAQARVLIATLTGAPTLTLSDVMVL